MKAYLAKKFHADYEDRDTIERISDALRNAGIETVVMARDLDKWGEIRFAPRELMLKTFAAIDGSDMLIVEFSEKGVGLGIEAGYAYAKGIPVFVIAKSGSEISDTIKGIAKAIFFYENLPEIAKCFATIHETPDVSA